MKVLVLVVPMALALVQGRQGGRRREEEEVATTTATTLGSTTTLSCRSPSPWFFCVWEGPDR